jgi:hypothetical protein
MHASTTEGFIKISTHLLLNLFRNTDLPLARTSEMSPGNRKKKHRGQVRQRTSALHHPANKYAVLLLILTFLVFGNSIQNGFSYDDKPFISENYLVQQGIKGIPKLLTTDFWAGYTGVSQTNPSYRPIPLITLAITHQFFGLNPGVHHFFNVLLYGLTCVLIYFLLLKYFRGKYPQLAHIVAILFCVHPIHTEEVAKIKARDDLHA